MKRLGRAILRRLDVDGVFLTPEQARTLAMVLKRAPVHSVDELDLVARFSKRVGELR